MNETLDVVELVIIDERADDEVTLVGVFTGSHAWECARFAATEYVYNDENSDWRYVFHNAWFDYDNLCRLVVREQVNKFGI